MSEPNPPVAVPEATFATSTNRPGTLTVRANDQGLPVEIHVDRRELRYGAEALSAEILRLCRSAGVEARARRRVELADAGIPDEILDRLGLPTRAAADADLATTGGTGDDPDVAPPRWMRRL